MSAPALSLASGPATRAGAPPLDPAVEPASASADGRDEGFAAALDDATAAMRDDVAAASDFAASTPAVAAPMASAVASAPAAPAAASPTAAAPDSTTAGGWPPPGLSSLFPPAPLPAAALANGARALRLPPLDGGAVALPPDALGPRPPEPALSAAGLAAPALLATHSAAQANVIAQAPAHGHALAADPIAAALARQPAALRLPITDEEGATLETLTVGSLAAPEALSGLDTLPALASTPGAAPRLDLAQAFPMPIPLPSPRFAEELGARVQWIAEQQGGEATLRLAPEGLGPVEIRLKLDGERVDLGFSATQQETRQALEQALPKLREMLAQQGLQLGHADVGHRQSDTPQEGRRGGGRGSADDDAVGGVIGAGPRANEATLVIGRGARGVLDLYA